MQILIIGATGLIGSQIVARLLARGHNVIGVARRIERARRALADVRWISRDMAERRAPDDWLPLLLGVDAVVNCAGALQDSPSDDLKGVHTEGAATLFEACERAGVARVIHFSAIGVDRETPSDFSRTKHSGDEALTARNLDWVILRPSVVLGRPAYGASALIRGLAALPVLPVMPATAPLQPVQLEDVVDTVEFFLSPEAPSRVAIELAGPERHTFADVVLHYRRWLGLADARRWALPEWLANALYRLGDFAGLLGWQTPLRTTARREMARGAIGEPAEWTRLTGIRPRSLSDALVRQPASLQEKWFASLYFLKPLTFVVFSLFWIVTAFLSLGPGYEIGVALMTEGGAGPLAGPSVIAGGLADLVIGIGIAFRRTARPALYAALGLSLFYAAAGTAILPRLWIDPIGPLVKIWPIMVLNLVALALLRER